MQERTRTISKFYFILSFSYVTLPCLLRFYNPGIYPYKTVFIRTTNFYWFVQSLSPGPLSSTSVPFFPTETLLPIYKTTWHYTPAYSSLDTHSHENLKFHPNSHYFCRGEKGLTLTWRGKRGWKKKWRGRNKEERL
jgi:hypothetical protein